MFGQSAFGRTTATPAFGGFGASNNTQQNQPAATNVFGAPAAQQNQPTSNPFGGANASNATGNSLFGGARPATTFGTGLFGSAQPATNSGNAFGSSAAATGGVPSLFGNTAQNTGSAPATGQAAATGANMFGAQSTTQPSMGFGAATNAFGQPAQQQQQQQPLFGQTQPATNIFGQPQQQQQQQQPSTNIFGQPTQQQAPQQQSAFGATGGGSLFGSTLGIPSQQQQQQSTPSGSLFGGPSASTAGLFGSRASPFVSSQQQSQSDSAQAQFSNLTQRIEAVAQAWDASSPQCRFQHYFYNLVDPATVHLYVRPQNAVDEATWQKAVRENPDPSCYVPVLAVGFDDLQKRVEAQRQQARSHQDKLQELKKQIIALSEAHLNKTAPRLRQAASLQIQINQRLVRLAQHLHLLIPSVRSSAIRPEEEALRATLEGLEEEIRRPGGAGVGRLKGKLSELWAALGAIEAARERERSNGESGVEWAVVDSEGLQRLTQILAEEQSGIAHLTKIVQGHLRDLDVIYGKPPQEREQDAFSSPQANQILLGASLRSSK